MRFNEILLHQPQGNRKWFVFFLKPYTSDSKILKQWTIHNTCHKHETPQKSGRLYRTKKYKGAKNKHEINNSFNESETGIEPIISQP